MLSKVRSLKKKRNGKKGFTLVELVIVIAILGIIAAIAIPTVKNVINNANKAHDESSRQSVELALKTTWSEIESGQSTLLDTATVADALKENGILGTGTHSSEGVLPDLKVSDYSWGYTTGGKIVLKDGTTLSETDALSTVMA